MMDNESALLLHVSLLEKVKGMWLCGLCVMVQKEVIWWSVDVNITWLWLFFIFLIKAAQEQLHDYTGQLKKGGTLLWLKW